MSETNWNLNLDLRTALFGVVILGVIVAYVVWGEIGGALAGAGIGAAVGAVIAGAVGLSKELLFSRE